MKTNLNKENLEKLLKDSKVTLISTNKGCVIEGNLVNIMGAFSMLVNQLNKGVPRDLLKYAFKSGLKEKPNDKENDEEETKKALRSMLDSLNRDFEELFGDDDDE